MERPLQEKRRGVTVKSNHLPRFDTATCIAGKHDGVSEETTIDRKDLTGAGDQLLEELYDESYKS